MSEFKKFPLPTQEEEDFQEALGLLWSLVEKGELARAEAALAEIVGPGLLPRLAARGLVSIDGGLRLTEEGERQASEVVRRHRLAERMLTDVLELPSEAVEADACRMEHVLSAGVSEAICTLLGHPRFCPHGSAIPRGRCCAEALGKVESVLKPLDRLAEGERGRVAYLVFPDGPDAQRLLAMGLVPGAEVAVDQVRPAFVVSVGENVIAMEGSVASGVYVRG